MTYGRLITDWKTYQANEVVRVPWFVAKELLKLKIFVLVTEEDWKKNGGRLRNIGRDSGLSATSRG